MAKPEFHSRFAQVSSWLLIVAAIALLAFSATARCPRALSSLVDLATAAWIIFCFSGKQLPLSVNQFTVVLGAGLLASGAACVYFWNHPVAVLIAPAFLLLLLVFAIIVRLRLNPRIHSRNT